jgi:hypothetical protein
MKKKKKRFVEHFNCKNSLNKNYLYLNLTYFQRPYIQKKHPEYILKSLYCLLKQICEDFFENKSQTLTKKITKNINYKKLIKSELIEDIKKEVYYLQKFNILSIFYYFFYYIGLNTQNEKKSFFINLFNIMNIHSLIEVNFFFLNII